MKFDLKQFIQTNPKLSKKYAKAKEVVLLPIDPSNKVELDYRLRLIKIVDTAYNELKTTLLPKLKLYEPYYSRAKKLTDVKQYLRDDDYYSDISVTIDDVRDKLNQQVQKISDEIATGFAYASNDSNWQYFYRNMKRQFGIDFASYYDPDNELLQQAITNNVELITSIEVDFLSKVKLQVLDNVRAGNRYEELAKNIQNQYLLTKNRAKLIARDQTSKLNSAISESRALDMGCEEYDWSTSHDERVRATHKANEGKRFNPNKPPPTGNPGHEYQCRCVALWVIKL